MAFVASFTLYRSGFMQIGMAEGGQILPPPPPRNFCLNGINDLKFGMWIVLGKISRYRVNNLRKKCQKVLKILISAFFLISALAPSKQGLHKKMP